jgi:hypothetical protein
VIKSLINKTANEKQIFYPSDIKRYINTNSFYLGRGGEFTGGPYLKRKGDVIVPESILQAHGLFVGVTRSGKSVLLKSIASQAIRKGWGVMVIDFKPDADLYQAVFMESLKTERINDFIFFSPNLAAIRDTKIVFPSSSATYNPFLFGTQEEIVSKIKRSISNFDKQTGGDKFWEDVQIDAIDACVGSLMGMDKVFNWKDIWTLLVKPDAQLYVLEHTKNIQAREKLREIHIFFKKNYDTAQKYYLGTKIAIGEYALSEISQYLNSYDPNLNIYDAVHKKKIVHVALSALLSEKTSSGMAKLLISDLNSIIGHVVTEQKKLKTRFLVIIDEFSRCIFGGVEDLFAMAAGAGITLLVGFQSLSDIEQKGGAPLRKRIMANTQTKVFMMQTDAEAPQTLAEIAGKTYRSKTKTYEYSIFNPFSSFEKNIRKEETNIIEPSFLTNLEPLNFYARIGTQNFRGVVPIIPSVTEDPGIKYHYNHTKEDNSRGLGLFEKFCDDIYKDKKEEK